MKIGVYLKSKVGVDQLSDRWIGPVALATQIPSLGFWGVRVLELSPSACEVRLPYSFRTKNPFRSIYFSALLGAGELASGALVLKHLGGSKQISMLVVEMQSRFLKKARSEIRFKCEEGELIRSEVERALKGEAVEFWARSVGFDAVGDIICELKVKWSLLGRAERIS